MVDKTTDGIEGQDLQTDYRAEIEAIIAKLVSQLSPGTARTYRNDINTFLKWLGDRGQTIYELKRRDMVDYGEFLVRKEARHIDIYKDRRVDRNTGRTISPKTVSRMFNKTVSVFLDEVVVRGHLAANPADGVKPLDTGNEKTSHRALTKEEAQALLESVDRSTKSGKRDYAVLMVMLRTGLLRAEASALNVGDIMAEEGQSVLIVQHGKGGKTRTVKLPMDVLSILREYEAAVGRAAETPEEPLFVHIGRHETVTRKRLSARGIERIVNEAGERIGIPGLTPRGLHATFISLALEAGNSI